MESVWKGQDAMESVWKGQDAMESRCGNASIIKRKMGVNQKCPLATKTTHNDVSNRVRRHSDALEACRNYGTPHHSTPVVRTALSCACEPC